MTEKKSIDDRFKRFGTVSFTAVTRVNDFIDHLQAGTVSGTRCRGCGRLFFPPRAHCCDCLSGDMDWFPVKGIGRLVSFSRLQYAPSGFEADVPYSLGLVDFTDCKVFGRIAAEVPDTEITVGMPMRAVARRLESHRISYVFVPARE